MVGPTVLSGPRRSLRLSQRKSTVMQVATFLHFGYCKLCGPRPAEDSQPYLPYRCAINVNLGHHHVIFPSSTASL